MTDARLPERLLADRRFLRLTPVERSDFVMALLFAVSNRTDGRIENEDIPLIPTFHQPSINALVGCGLWTSAGGAWTIADFAETQTSSHELARLENVRRADREKKARQRAERRSASPGQSPGHVPGTVPEDSTGEERKGQERKYQRPSGDVAVAFEAAYARWPKKTEKQRSLIAFEKAARSVPLEQLVTDVQRFGDAYASTTERRYIPALATWLKGERWEDDLPGVTLPTNDDWGAFLAAESSSPVARIDPDALPTTLAPYDCGPGRHQALRDGTCARCTARFLNDSQPKEAA